MADRKILIFADWYEPGYKAGGPIRSLKNMVDVLDDDVFVWTRDRDLHERKPYENVPVNRWIQRAPDVHVFYADPSQLKPLRILQLLKSQAWDVVYLNSLYSVYFSILPLVFMTFLGRRTKVVLAPRGMLNPGALSIKSTRKKFFLTVCRWFGLFRGVHWHATSEEEEMAIRDNFGFQAEVQLVPNLPTYYDLRFAEPPSALRPKKLVTISRISREKGIKESLEFLQSYGRKEELIWDVYGPIQDPHYFKECMAVAGEERNVRFFFKGELSPELIPSVLEQCDGYLSTTLGENFGHSIAEAMLSGVPVIISNRTPWMGLQQQGIGWDLPLEAEAFHAAFDAFLDATPEEVKEQRRRLLTFKEQFLKERGYVERYRSLFASVKS